MPANFTLTAVEVLRILPEIILSLVGTMVMVGEATMGERGRTLLRTLTIGGLVAALFGAIIAYGSPGLAFSELVIVDGFATFFRILVIAVGILTVLSSYQYFRREQHENGEFYALLLFSIVGQSVMVSAHELIMVFIGLEISSIATYVMAGYLRDDRRNNESALKYFLLGSFATAFLLYGIAWIYGLAGSTNLTEIRGILMNTATAPPALLTGMAAALMFVGFAFKVSAAPFQAWAPDVYQGAPAPVSAFMSAAPKAAAFAILLRVFGGALQPVSETWEPIIWTSALLTMIIGNFAALQQTNIKRLLAYSSIAHAGYVLVAVTSNTEIGTAAAMFYLAAYSFMNIGAFAVVTHMARGAEKYVQIDDYAGLAAKQPGTAAFLSIFLLSLIGVPLTAGFFGKFYIFKAALDANLVWLTVLGLLNSAVAAYYYLRLLVVMYMNEPGEAAATVPALTGGLRMTLWVTAAATLILGIFPSLVLNFAGSSTSLLK
ncbi:MAG: NADH-quinone oxidoreductase subunit N [Bryobacteraceae bacterium]